MSTFVLNVSLVQDSLVTSVMQKQPVTGLKIFVITIPNEGMAGTSPAQPSVITTPTIELYSLSFTDYILLGVLTLTEGLSMGSEYCHRCSLIVTGYRMRVSVMRIIRVQRPAFMPDFVEIVL